MLNLIVIYLCISAEKHQRSTNFAVEGDAAILIFLRRNTQTRVDDAENVPVYFKIVLLCIFDSILLIMMNCHLCRKTYLVTRSMP